MVGYIMLVDEQGKIIAHNQPELIDETINDFRLPEKQNPVMSTIKKMLRAKMYFKSLNRLNHGILSETQEGAE